MISNRNKRYIIRQNKKELTEFISIFYNLENIPLTNNIIHGCRVRGPYMYYILKNKPQNFSIKNNKLKILLGHIINENSIIKHIGNKLNIITHKNNQNIFLKNNIQLCSLSIIEKGVYQPLHVFTLQNDKSNIIIHQSWFGEFCIPYDILTKKIQYKTFIDLINNILLINLDNSNTVRIQCVKSIYELFLKNSKLSNNITNLYKTELESVLKNKKLCIFLYS